MFAAGAAAGVGAVEGGAAGLSKRPRMSFTVVWRDAGTADADPAVGSRLPKMFSSAA